MSAITLHQRVTVDHITPTRAESLMLAVADGLTALVTRNAQRRHRRLLSGAEGTAAAQRDRVLADAHMIGALRR